MEQTSSCCANKRQALVTNATSCNSPITLDPKLDTTINHNPDNHLDNHLDNHKQTQSDSSKPPSELHYRHMVSLEGGSFQMGTDSSEGFPADGEGPVRVVTVAPFQISKFAVTNEQFADFVEATGYVTEAESFGWSYVFQDFVAEQTLKEHSIGTTADTPWWVGINGAHWAMPEGPGSSYEGREQHPVVHISWNDAVSYCQWMGGRLPTEAEWEYAARGGLSNKRYPWGDELTPNKQHQCNIWQGKFPKKNHALDGHIGTAPVDAYAPNGYGLYQMSGNVWEWCADYFDARYHQLSSSHNPLWTKDTGVRSIRGGSYLCHRDYCNRYRIAARSRNTPDSSSGHCGFRVVI